MIKGLLFFVLFVLIYADTNQHNADNKDYQTPCVTFYKSNEVVINKYKR